ncbi:Pantothenate transporter FEN2 [Lecanosticta acicola]|uniref:Pantothenate transporter FEN2 n=1 Tax=Lecanosticta acicola TaxID=111012 RepID=A0AAI8YVY0_9PEZI|nr:Pantothenate transporter FEN2 [Lecanosticta acicola]
MGFLHKLRVVVWGEPPPTKEEARLLFKIDWFILSYVCSMYWVNYLDRANLNNAYVSGAQQDLGFKGTQLNQINTIFYGGYLLGQIPNNLILQKIPPRIWLPTTCLCWGFLTLGTGFTQHPWQIMVIRFFQGFFEASCFVGVQWILGSWYKPHEIGKRTAIFTSSGLAGQLFSGIMQGAIYTNLNGVSGLAGWRWLFVIDFLITLPISIYGFLLFPDTPVSTKAKYFSHSEKVLASERLPKVERRRGVLGWSLIRRVLLSWHWWGFVLLWIAGSNTEMYSSNAIMQLWLKDIGGYSVPQVNYIPSSVSGMGIVATLLLGWYTDFNPRHRWHVGILLSFTAIISGALMLSPPTKAAKFAALILNGCQYAGQTVFFAWANDLTRKDDAKRSIVVACMNMFSVAVYLFWSLLFYNATQAPDWFEGNCAMIAMGGFTLVMTLACYFGQRWQEKQDFLESNEWPATEEETHVDEEKTKAR